MATAATVYVPFNRANGDVLGQVAIDGSETIITFKRQNIRDYLDAPLTLQIAGQTWQYKSAAGGALIQLGDGQTMIVYPSGGDASYAIVVKGGTGAGFLNIVVGR
jgi:hypothetical protein